MLPKVHQYFETTDSNSGLMIFFGGFDL